MGVCGERIYPGFQGPLMHGSTQAQGCPRISGGRNRRNCSLRESVVGWGADPTHPCQKEIVSVYLEDFILALPGSAHCTAQPHYVLIDTEGYDWKVLSTIDLQKVCRAVFFQVISVSSNFCRSTSVCCFGILPASQPPKNVFLPMM